MENITRENGEMDPWFRESTGFAEGCCGAGAFFLCLRALREYPEVRLGGKTRPSRSIYQGTEEEFSGHGAYRKMHGSEGLKVAVKMPEIHGSAEPKVF